MQFDVFCGLVQPCIKGDVKEDAADFYSQSNFPIVDFVVENLLKMVVLEMLEVLLTERGEHELCSWSGENAQAISAALDKVVSKKYWYLNTVCPQVIYGVVWDDAVRVVLHVIEIKAVVGDAERSLCLQIELVLAHSCEC